MRARGRGGRRGKEGASGYSQGLGQAESGFTQAVLETLGSLLPLGLSTGLTELGWGQEVWESPCPSPGSSLPGGNEVASQPSGASLAGTRIPEVSQHGVTRRKSQQLEQRT